MHNLTFIPVLDWTFLKQKEKSEIKFENKLMSNFELLATDISGDFVTIVENKVVIVDHSNISNTLYLCDADTSFWELLNELSEISSFEEEADIAQLTSAKAALIKIKKNSPKGVKKLLKERINEIKEQISDLKFSTSAEGDIFNRVQEFRKSFNQILGKPKKYQSVDFEWNPSIGKIEVFGWCVKPNETTIEAKDLIHNITTEFEVLIKYLKSFDDFQEYQRQS